MKGFQLILPIMYYLFIYSYFKFPITSKFTIKVFQYQEEAEIFLFTTIITAIINKNNTIKTRSKFNSAINIEKS